MPLLQLIVLILGGALAALAFGIRDLQNTQWYSAVIATLLAIGLYASTYGIDLKEARKHIKIILSAVTLGVLVKSIITGATLAFLFHDPFFFILGITVAQIDPLSVASLMKGRRMSKKAKTILASWASFDDPVTVLLSLYAPLLVIQLTGIEVGSIAGGATTTDSFVAYLRELGLNLGLAAQAFCLYTVIRFYAKKIAAWVAAGVSLALYALLALTFSVSIVYFMMLGIALIGLFLRPPKVDNFIETVIKWALCFAAILLGLLLIGGINPWKGIALGIMAYIAQIFVGFILTQKLNKKDSWHIAFAQQNGITAIILALLFESVHPGTVAIVAPAIIVINTLHWLCNLAIDRTILKQHNK
jgi:NhaP-type Na+/H+ or K+/H+ antiporter